MTKFISLQIRNCRIVHGYAQDNTEIVETVEGEQFAEKLIAIDRIRSATEQYLLVTSSHERVMYWEYQGGLGALKARLDAAGLVIA